MLKPRSPLTLLLLVALLAGTTHAMESGFTLESFTDSERDRPITIDWWYPVVNEPASPFHYGLGSGRVVEVL